MRPSKELVTCMCPTLRADNPALMKKHEEIEKQNTTHLANLVAMKHVKHNLMGTNWKALQEADPIISYVLKWKKMNESNRTKGQKSSRSPYLGGVFVNSH